MSEFTDRQANENVMYGILGENYVLKQVTNEYAVEYLYSKYNSTNIISNILL